ncbi:sulfurtransferase TusA family protein [Dethiosulfovibrio salsuginis]|nr:sulfurtransferase TusA family protein [Dethiosulfovibrio salsuginis]
MSEIRKVDCLGDFCPIPGIKARLAMNGMRPGDQVLLVSDHSCAPLNVRDVVEEMGCSVKIEEVIPGVFEMVISKSSPSPDGA